MINANILCFFWVKKKATVHYVEKYTKKYIKKTSFKEVKSHLLTAFERPSP